MTDSFQLQNITYPDQPYTREMIPYAPTLNSLAFDQNTFRREGPIWAIPTLLHLGAKAIIAAIFDLLITTPIITYKNISQHYQIRNLDLKLEHDKPIEDDLEQIGFEIAYKAKNDPVKLKQLIVAYATDKCFLKSLTDENKLERQNRLAGHIAHAAITSYADLYIAKQIKDGEYLFNRGIHNLNEQIYQVSFEFAHEEEIKDIFKGILRPQYKRATEDNSQLYNIGLMQYASESDSDSDDNERSYQWLQNEAISQSHMQRTRLVNYLNHDITKNIPNGNPLIAEPF